MEECNNEFKPEILILDSNPIGFNIWCQNIKFKKYKIILPDKSSIDGKIFFDFNGIFDRGAYTKYLIGRFNEIINDDYEL